MVKAYLRYEAQDAFGTVVSNGSNSVFDASGRLAIVPALEDVVIWNIKQGVRISTLKGDKAEVSALALSPDGKFVAAGYADGRIRVWTVPDGVCLLTLHGHKSAVTSLRYNAAGSLLASGSKDTDVIVWDPVGETGLYRLRGHKDEVTDLAFLTHSRHLISSSKDALLKIWDLDTQHCVETVVGHRQEIWSFDINASETRLVTGSSDSEIRVYSLRLNAQVSTAPVSLISTDAASDEPVPEASRLAVFMGSLHRSSKQRVVLLRYNANNTLLACQGADKSLELYSVRSDAEVTRKMKRRLKRQRDKVPAGSAAAAAAGAQTASGDGADALATTADEFGVLIPLRAHHKIRSFCFAPPGSVVTPADASADVVHDRLLLALTSNALHVYDVAVSEKSSEKDDAPSYVRSHTVELPGHRSAVRTVALSSDDSLLMSTSTEQIKIWNLSTRQCIRTLDSGYGLCGMFAPGGRHVIIGTKEGHLELWDIGSATLLQRVEAHAGSVWAIDMRPDQRGFATGGGDKEVKFWDFELMIPAGADRHTSAKQLSFVHTRTLKLTEDVLCIKHSPDGKLIAVGQLDSTIKVFFEDSLKFSLSLYGHKLPVLSIDISSDSTLLVSGSADKNVKIWGLDFGDCHRSLFAHQDSVMRVQFVNKTHYFFSVGKDRMMKYWDADKFENILTLEGHHAEVWALTVSSAGDTVVTAANDKSIRVWKQTDEQVFLDEEREKKMEELFEQGASVEQKKIGDMDGSGIVPDQSTAVVQPGQKTSSESLKAGEKIIASLDIAIHEDHAWAEYYRKLTALKSGIRAAAAPLPLALQRAIQSTGLANMDTDEDSAADVSVPPPNPYLDGMSPYQHVYQTLKSVRSSDMEEALLTLPFDYAIRLLKYLELFIERGLDIELCVRCVVFLLTIHQNQIVSQRLLVSTLDSLRRHTRRRLQQEKDDIGFNVAALKYLKAELAQSSTALFFGPETVTPDYVQPLDDMVASKKRKKPL